MFGELTNSYRNSETEVVSIERIKEYIELENEPIWKNSIKAQPSDSSVEFEGVSLRYREQDAAVINKVSFRVEPGEKIGIVGRTGAGKTSLTSLLFRLVEPFEGTIRIGGVDICNLGPNLRRILTIIPQDPVLFCGTLRSNLDPFEEFADQELWNALEKAHLSEFAHSLIEGLNYEIADGGNNLRFGYIYV
jgi:ABC-type multidrug transport system fused ATPase/permease subunit